METAGGSCIGNPLIYLPLVICQCYGLLTGQYFSQLPLSYDKSNLGSLGFVMLHLYLLQVAEFH